MLRDSAGVTLQILRDRLLGDPDVYVLDDQRAWPNWQAKGHEGVMAHLVTGSEALPGMSRPDEAARFLVHHMLTAAGDAPGIHVFVTHDSLVTATAARLLGRPLGADAWPWYLEGAVFWRAADGVHVGYREFEHVRETPLCSLDDGDVIEFARREVAATLGLEPPARFFLAGEHSRP